MPVQDQNKQSTAVPASGSSTIQVPGNLPTPQIKIDGNLPNTIKNSSTQPQPSTNPSAVTQQNNINNSNVQPVNSSPQDAPQQAQKQSDPDIPENGVMTLADILFSQGAINEDAAKKIKLAEIQSGRSQEEIITSQDMAAEADLTKAKAQLYSIPYVDLSTVPVSPEALSILPQEVASRFKVYPFGVDPVAKRMNVAMVDPMDLTAIEFIEQKTGMQIIPHAGEPSRVINLIQTSYTTSLAKEVSAALHEMTPKDSVKTLDMTKTGLIREEKVGEIVTHILSFAVKSRASDIHVEPEERSTRVRYRIDGILLEKLTIPSELHDALVARVKILSGMKIDEKRVPQDGRFNFKTEDQEIDLRVSTLPTTWGEKIVMRLLRKTGGIPELTELGLRGKALKNLQDNILRPHGIILITGPTGSGKTTTLYSIISMLNTAKVNIMTLEDPVEYKIQGVNQVQINPVAGLTFASGLRSFLRQDPNIILVGEIRDKETADLAIQASLTGHLVFSTLHTNDAAGALPRMLDMGAEPYLLASTINCIVAQRVARKIHDGCRESYKPEPKVEEDIRNVLGPLLPQKKEIQLFRGKGDAECGNSGYYGRAGVFEVLPITEKISRLILEQATSGDIDKAAKAEGMISMKQDGYMKAVEGMTTLEEVLRVAQE